MIIIFESLFFFSKGFLVSPNSNEGFDFLSFLHK